MRNARPPQVKEKDAGSDADATDESGAETERSDSEEEGILDADAVAPDGGAKVDGVRAAARDGGLVELPETDDLPGSGYHLRVVGEKDPGHGQPI